MAPRANAKGKGRRRQGRGSTLALSTRQSANGAVNPPMINNAPRLSRRFQFNTTLDVTKPLTVTRQCLLSLLISISGAGNGVAQTAVPLMSAVRVKRLTLHVPGSATSDTTHPIPSIEWLSDLGPPIVLTRPNLSSTIPSVFSTAPPRLSRAAMWSRASAATLTLQEVIFSITVQDQGETQSTTIFPVLTVDVEYVNLCNDGASIAATFTGVTTSGTYGMPLDCLTTSSVIGPNRWIPIGLPVPVPAASIVAFTRTN